MSSKIMSNGIENVHRFVDPFGRFMARGFGLPALLGLGSRAGKQLLDWSVFGPLRLGMRLLRQLKLSMVNLLELVARGIRSAGRTLQEVFLFWPMRACMLLLERLKRSVQAVVNTCRHLIELVEQGIRRAIRRLVELFVFAPIRACRYLMELVAQGIRRATRRLVELFVFAPIRGCRLVLEKGQRLAQAAGRAGMDLLDLSVLRPASAAKRIMAKWMRVVDGWFANNQKEVEPTFDIRSIGGPRAAQQIVENATVLITSGQFRGPSFQVGEQPLIIGSGDACDILLPDAEGVAEEHLRIWRRDGRLMLHHLAPGVETIVAGNAVDWASLGDGEEAWFGPFLLRFSIAAPQQEQDPEMMDSEMMAASAAAV